MPMKLQVQGLPANGGRCHGLMVHVLDSGSGSLGSSPGDWPGQGHRFVFLDKAFSSHSASLHPGV